MLPCCLGWLYVRYTAQAREHQQIRQAAGGELRRVKYKLPRAVEHPQAAQMRQQYALARDLNAKAQLTLLMRYTECSGVSELPTRLLGLSLDGRGIFRSWCMTSISYSWSTGKQQLL